MKKLIFSFILIFFSQTVLGYTNTVKPLPPVTEIQGEAPSLDDTIQAMYVSAEFDVPQELQNKVIANVDLVKLEVDVIWDLIRDTSVPNSEKEIVLIRYTVGDKRMHEALVAARKAGIKTTVMIDFNPIFKGDFPNGEKFTHNVNPNNIRSSAGEDSPGAQFVLELLKAGFEIGKDLLSQPIYNEEKIPRVPIQHEKALLVRKGAKKRTYYTTANLAPNPRYNRTIESVEPKLYDYYYKHVEDMAEAFRKGGEIDDIKSQNRLTIRYADGSWQELAFTDGKFNPNDRITEALKKPFSKLLLSHFVITNRGFVEELRNQLENNSNSGVFYVADDRFSSQNEWGLAIVLEGADVWAPFGKPVWGFKEKLTHQVEGYVYQRPAVDPDTGKIRIETSEEGPPTGRHVWHDKSTMIVYKDGTAILFTGSLNLSNNFHNAEFQAAMGFKQSSWIAKGMQLSVNGVVNKEKMQYALPVEFALMRNALGLVTRRTDLEVPISLTEKIFDAVLKRDADYLETQLRFLGKLSSNLKDPLTAEEISHRVDKFIRFYRWYIQKLPPTKQSPEYRIKRMANIAVLMSNENLPDFKKVQILRSILWRPHISDTDLNAMILEAIKVMNIRIENPDNLFFERKSEPTKSNENKNRRARVYDWDDTIMYMPTKIILFRKGSNDSIQVTTQEYAEIREHIGQPGSKYENYEIRKNEARPEFSSFQFFRSNSGVGVNYFYEDVKRALNSLNLNWMAPSFMDFIGDLADPIKSKDTYILTARGHSALEIQQALDLIAKYAKDRFGLNLYPIPIENIFAVGAAQDPSGKKSEILIKLAETYQKKGYAGLTFKDDDAGNVRKAQEAFKDKKFPSFNVDIEHILPSLRMCKTIFFKAG